MSMIRKAVVSGTFYPSAPDEIEDFIKECIPQHVKPTPIKAAMLPHAGYIYSGKVAVETAAHITPKKRLLILGPNHTGRGAPFSVFTQGTWQTPLGDIEVDRATAEKIAQKALLQQDFQAHRYEHSIEVQLPILQYFFKEFTFIPIACMIAEFKLYRQIAKVIHEALIQSATESEFLLIASSDMTHYEPHKEAEKKDKYVIEAILNLDTQEFLKRISEKDVSMCGVAPVGIMLEVLRDMGAKSGKLIKYTTSAEATNDYSSVVGYAGVVFN